jgi:ribosomal protein L13
MASEIREKKSGVRWPDLGIDDGIIAAIEKEAGKELTRNEAEAFLREYNEYADSFPKVKTEELDEKRRKILDDAISEVSKDIGSFFGIKKVPVLDYEILKEGYEFGNAMASSDPITKKFRFSEDMIEKPYFILVIAEEMMHQLRTYMHFNEDHYVGEFFGHLAKRVVSEKTGIGKTGYAKSLIDTAKQMLYGSNYTPEEFEKTAKDYLKFIKTSKNPEDRKNAIKSFRHAIDAMLPKNMERDQLLAYQLEIISEDKEMNLDRDSPEKDFLNELVEIKEKLRNYKTVKKSETTDMQLRSHLVGYDSVDRLFKYIKSGAINPKELFYKDPKEVEKYLFFDDMPKPPAEDFALKKPETDDIEKYTKPSDKKSYEIGIDRKYIKPAADVDADTNLSKGRMLYVKGGYNHGKKKLGLLVAVLLPIIISIFLAGKNYATGATGYAISSVPLQPAEYTIIAIAGIAAFLVIFSSGSSKKDNSGMRIFYK